MTPAEALALHPEHVAYVEGLSAANAPTLTICADPDNSEESIDLTFAKADSLSRFKEFILAEMHRSNRQLEEELAAGITPAYYAQAPCLNS